MQKLAIPKTMQMSQGGKPKHVRLVSPGAAFTGAVAIDLLDGMGQALNRALQFEILSSHECEVDLSALPLGVYFLRIVDQDLFFVKRIVLN